MNAPGKLSEADVLFARSAVKLVVVVCAEAGAMQASVMVAETKHAIFIRPFLREAKR